MAYNSGVNFTVLVSDDSLGGADDIRMTTVGTAADDLCVDYIPNAVETFHSKYSFTLYNYISRFII